MWACSIGVLGPKLPNVLQSLPLSFQTVTIGRVNSIRASRSLPTFTLHTCHEGETFGVLTLEQFVAKLPTVEAPPLNSLAVFSKVNSSPFWLLARFLAAASSRARKIERARGVRDMQARKLMRAAIIDGKLTCPKRPQLTAFGQIQVANHF